MKYLPIVLIVIIIILGLTWFMKDESVVIVPGETDEVTTLEYKNEKYGYTLRYPKTLSHKEDTVRDVVMFGTEINRTFTPSAELRVFTIEAQANETFEAAVGREIAKLCAGMSTTTSPDFKCTGVDNLEPFFTTDNTKGYEIDLIGRSTATTTGPTLQKGPFFLIPLHTSATVNKVLVLYPPLMLGRETTDASTLRVMARSVTPTSKVSSPNSVEEYVRANIKGLSTEAMVPGGAFYVTSIEMKAGTGTVSYRDNDSTHIADFTYSNVLGGSVGINSFKVRN